MLQHPMTDAHTDICKDTFDEEGRIKVFYIFKKHNVIKPLKDHRGIIVWDERDESVISKGQNCRCDEFY